MLDFNTPNISIGENNTDRYGSFEISPLERGFGTTLGNSLRRVMLSSLPGSAAVYIKIDGVQHEFSTINGVKEDVCEIVLNIKGIIAQLETDEVKKAYIEATGPMIVTAGDIKCDSELTIVNPELVIATLGDGAKLNMEIGFARGRGYVPAEKNKEIYNSSIIGTIPVDSIFSPVLKVNYTVENTRVGNITDYDLLKLEVNTNGSITPSDAMSSAANIIMKHLQMISAISTNGFEPKMVDDKETKENKMLDTSIDELDFSVRSYNCLKRAGVNTIRDLTSKTVSDMMKIRNLGQKSFEEIRLKLADLGYSFSEED